MLLDTYRRAMASAFGSGLRLKRKPDPDYTLPTEVWEIVLDYAVAIPFLLDTDCSPVDFYFFAVAHRTWNAASAEREAYEERRKTLRAVCQRWKAIIDRQGEIWICLQSSSPVWSIPLGTRRVDVFLPPPLTSHTYIADDTELTPEINQAEFRNVQVLSLSELGPSKTYMAPQGNLIGLTNVLDAVEQTGSTSVHSFIYEGDVKLGPDHLQAINNAFPFLTSLTVYAMTINGTLSLPALISLCIFASTFDISQWDLPSLRHLALGGQRMTEASIRYEELKLGLIKGQICSLLILYPYWVTLKAEFWSAHPSLEFFGAPNIVSNSRKSTRIHNARTFCITGPKIDCKPDPHEGFSLHLPHFPRLKTFITPNKLLHTPQRPNARGFSALLKYCAEKDITWYVGYNQRAAQPRKRSKYGILSR